MCTKICSSPEELDAFLNNLKLQPCPFCKCGGTLNRHGFVRAFDENQQQIAVRAQRVFCSNRNGATGCGRTFSVWLANKVKRLSLGTLSLWAFLKQVVSGSEKTDAFRSLECSFVGSEPYRIWRRFLEAQSAIRTALASLCPPPDVKSGQPAAATLAHLETAFEDHPLDPIAAFQASLQVSFM